jgi:hypothetical protein
MIGWLLPALLPSWRFFDRVGAAPRLEWARTAGNAAPVWREFRPQPERREWLEVVQSLVWAPHRNETLFLLSCAERLLEAPEPARERVLLTRLRELARAGELPGGGHEDQLHVRIVITERDGDALASREAWRAAPVAMGSPR